MENRPPVENLERLTYPDRVTDKTPRVTSPPLAIHTTLPREDSEGRLIRPYRNKYYGSDKPLRKF